MDQFTILNYQGSKSSLREFIYDNLKPYLKDGKALLDIFSGSCAVSNMFRDVCRIFANDSELYASIIANSFLNQPDFSSHPAYSGEFEELFERQFRQLSAPVAQAIRLERDCIERDDGGGLTALYKGYPSVWNQEYSDILHDKLTVEGLREQRGYYLFSAYYAGNYFGIEQALEIDACIKCIHMQESPYRDILFSCLFYAMKETVFSKDGHMAQPLNPETNTARMMSRRARHILPLFLRKLNEYIDLAPSRYNGDNIVFQGDFEKLLAQETADSVGLIYADPPYTDMQYSRYYHLLNVAARYDFPALTVSKNGYTKGLYTEGRYQSKLSQHAAAKGQLEKLIRFCAEHGINLALSYAYPMDTKRQATDRYTISISELIGLAQAYFGADKVKAVSQEYTHANHRNSAQKKVHEYLILCGTPCPVQDGLDRLKLTLSQTAPSKKNPMYDSHIYWSQKAYNICDILISSFTQQGDVVFDPFLGSGVTTLEAIRAGMDRRAVGCDINDMPLFISKTLLSINKTAGLEQALEDLAEKIRPLRSYYRTRCPECGGQAAITKVIFDKPERTQNKIELKTVFYECGCGRRLSKSADPEDLELMTADYTLANIRNTGLLRNSKIAVAENDDIRNIFTPRNLKVLDEILSVISAYSSSYQNIFHYILMSVLHLCKITDKHSNSQWPLWIPKTDCVEKNAVDIFLKKIDKFRGLIPFMKLNYTGCGIADSFEELTPGNCFLMQKGSQTITPAELPDDSVDLIITDPPYLEQVLYSEYMQLYRPFLGLEFNLEDEIVISSAPSRNKTKDSYFDLLARVFAMCSSKLKEGKYLCLYFHDCSLEVWNRLIRVLEDNRFRFVTQTHIDKTITLKNIISPKKSLNGDSILFFVKDSAAFPRIAPESLEEIERSIIRQSRLLVQSHSGLSTPQLYDDGLMEMLIHNGWLPILSEKYSTLVELFEKHLTWNPESCKWIL